MDQNEERFFVSMVLLVKRWRRFLLINTVAVTLAAVIISLLLPKWYLGEAKILGGRSAISELGLASFVPDLPLGGLGLLPSADESLRYLAILNSRKVKLEIIRIFELQSVYDQPDWEKTITTLEGNIGFEINPDESISVLVLDKSPDRAAQMANYFVHLLDSINVNLNTEQAHNNRMFLESRLYDNKMKLHNAEIKLKEFQEEHGILDITEQARVAISNIASLEATLLLKDTELRTKQNYYSDDHFEIEKLRLQIESYKQSLKKLRNGQADSIAVSGSAGTNLIATRDVPGLGMQYYRLVRNVEVQNILYKVLTQQYEQSRFMEAKTTSTIQTLDEAVPPIYKNRPKRALIVIGAFVFSICFGLLYCILSERWHNLNGQINPS